MRIGQGAVPNVDVTDRITRDVGWVADRWLRELRAGRAFSMRDLLGPSAGNISHLQLFNPAASGITVIVYRVLIGSDTAGQIHLAKDAAQRANLTGTGQNLLTGGAVSAAQIRNENNAAGQGTVFASALVALTTFVPFDTNWLGEMPPGNGLTIRPNVANAQLTASFFWIEI